MVVKLSAQTARIDTPLKIAEKVTKVAQTARPLSNYKYNKMIHKQRSSALVEQTTVMKQAKTTAASRNETSIN